MSENAIKRLSIFLAMEECDLERLPAERSLALAEPLGLTRKEYIEAVDVLYPEHAAMQRSHADVAPEIGDSYGG